MSEYRKAATLAAGDLIAYANLILAVVRVVPEIDGTVEVQAIDTDGAKYFLHRSGTHEFEVMDRNG